MGENVTTSGIDLLALPTGTRLHLGGEAVVEVTGLRNPCRQLDSLQPGLMAATLDRDGDGNLIRKAGIMAIVVSGGVVRRGRPDPGRAAAPAAPPARAGLKRTRFYLTCVIYRRWRLRPALFSSKTFEPFRSYSRLPDIAKNIRRTMGKTILITGGAGFIGSHCAALLLEHGHTVKALDSLDPQIHGERAPAARLSRPPRRADRRRYPLAAERCAARWPMSTR